MWYGNILHTARVTYQCWYSLTLTKLQNPLQRQPQQNVLDDNRYVPLSDWTLCNNGDPYLETNLDLELDGSNVEPSASPSPTTGIHWEYQGSIMTTSSKKMPLCPTKVQSTHDKLIRSPIQSVMAVFPLFFGKLFEMK
jgi:hypothetical protein